MTVNPAVCYPVGMQPWRLLPHSRRPGIRVAIPAMIPGDPNILAPGRRRPPFDYKMRWRDPNHNLGHNGADSQRACNNQTDQSLKNHNAFSFFSYRSEEHTSELQSLRHL